MNSRTVLVLDLAPQTLAVVRSLGRAGYFVLVGRGRSKDVSEAEHSRYCGDVWVHPDLEDIGAFNDSLEKLLDKRPDIGVIFPVAEPGATALHNAAFLNNHSVHVSMVNEPLFSQCRNKERANELAHAAGLRIPASMTAYDIESLRRAKGSIGFPLIIKSLRSESLVHGRKAYIVHTEDEFETSFNVWPTGHRELLVQQYVSGRLSSAQYVASRGSIVGYCDVLIPRSMMPDDTGLGVEFDTIVPTRDQWEAVKKFVHHYNYDGPGLMQFIRQEESGDLYFLENNPRLGGGIAHAVDSGENLPLIALQAATQTTTSLQEFNPNQSTYRVPFRSYWLRRDLASLAMPVTQLSRRQKLDRIWKMLLALVRADAYFLWQWRDPMPALYAYWNLLKNISR